jgi:GntR family transcriptional regulator
LFSGVGNATHANLPRFVDHAALDNKRHMCHITAVTLFRFALRPGESIFDQVVYAAKRAFISGELAPGQPFPSVRALAAELKIHPNTAHKAVQHLIQERWLEARPGVGTVVAPPPAARAGDRKRLLQYEVEQLVVEAKRVDLDLEELVDAIQAQWQKLEKPELFAQPARGVVRGQGEVRR